MDSYLQPFPGLQLTEQPAIDRDVSFKCSYASNHDTMMYQWNRSSPALSSMRQYAQSVSIKAGWDRIK
jgi:hypothetical protein